MQMFSHPVLCCAVLCCAVLCCAVLCCAVACPHSALRCAVLCCAVLPYIQKDSACRQLSYRSDKTGKSISSSSRTEVSVPYLVSTA